jgi:hypothetical protein
MSRSIQLLTAGPEAGAPSAKFKTPGEGTWPAFRAGDPVTFQRGLVNGTATGTADRTGEILHILRGCAQVKTSGGEKVWVRMVDLRPAEEVAK